ncbi:hypothetical protein SAMN06265182_1247 [Persephonella hydrogeniphila]|uniref:Uncharacterized protein n=1 Tax=Persephonella hydrogeniphila TaxID=198703 RepID=A0A285NK68_9AQUI|nr:hypothetical protein [Persephonella hydrogeniphila]SNZ08276.1 hypothetical protein SAMN06265182_1247 [Persephonella hydrogeniphila]
MEKVSIAIAVTSGIATIISIATSTHPIVSFILGTIFGGSLMFAFFKRNTGKSKIEESNKPKSMSNETSLGNSTWFSDREFFDGYSYFWAMVNHHFKPFAKGSKDGIKYIVYACNIDDILPAYVIIPEDRNRIKEFSIVKKHIEDFAHFIIMEFRHSKNWSIFFDEFKVIA